MARALMLFLIVMFTFPAAARRSDDHAYQFEQVWGTVVRLVRVDYGFEVRDRDPDIGYVLFDYRDGNRTYPGSFELIRTEVRGQSQVRVTLQVPAMPSYIERMMLDKLQRKLLEDYGQPLPPPRATPVRERNDDDADDDSEDDESSDE